MKSNEDVYKKIINSIYLTLSKTAGIMPFGGRHYLEQVTRGVGEQILRDHGEEFNPESKSPTDICRAYFSALGHLDLDLMEKGTVQLEEEGDSVLVTMNHEQSIYRDYCRRAQEEGLLFYCPRLGALQSVLENTLGVEYSSVVEFEPAAGVCKGKIYPVKRRLQTEMVHFKDDTLDIAGERAVLFSREHYLSFLVAVNEYAPFILKKVLFESGYRSYLGVAREAAECYGSPLDSLQICFEEMKNCGMGRMELISLDVPVGCAVIRCHRSFEAAAVEGVELYRTPRVTCDLLRGQLSACLTVILGQPIICEEMQCAAMQGKYCEFHAYPEEENGEK